jgi:hypothetical protein
MIVTAMTTNLRFRRTISDSDKVVSVFGAINGEAGVVCVVPAAGALPRLSEFISPDTKRRDALLETEWFGKKFF